MIQDFDCLMVMTTLSRAQSSRGDPMRVFSLREGIGPGFLAQGFRLRAFCSGAAVTIAQRDECEAASQFVAERLDARGSVSVEVPHVDVRRAAGSLPEPTPYRRYVSGPTSHGVDSEAAGRPEGATRRFLQLAKGRVAMRWRNSGHREQKCNAPTAQPRCSRSGPLIGVVPGVTNGVRSSVAGVKSRTDVRPRRGCGPDVSPPAHRESVVIRPRQETVLDWTTDPQCSPGSITRCAAGLRCQRG